MTNKRPSRRLLKKWEKRSQYIVRRAYDRGPGWFLDQADKTARQQQIAKRYGHDLLRAYVLPANVDGFVDAIMRLFRRARPR